MQSSVDLKNN
jgi:hypothetical protein